MSRSDDCDWKLPDPERLLSRRHCTVEYYGGGWQVRDLSANGTRINAETEPIGNGLVRRLSDGVDVVLTVRTRAGAGAIAVAVAKRILR